MSILTKIEQAAVHALLFKAALSVVACLLALAIGAATIGGFLSVAASHGPVVAGAVLTGVFIGFAILILVGLWATVTLRKTSAHSTQAVAGKSVSQAESSKLSAQGQAELANQVASLVQRNPIASTGLALLAGIAVSSQPDLVRDVVKGINESKRAP